MHSTSLAALVAGLASNAFCKPVNTTTLPVVDLGYELHQAISYNASTDAFKFANIRYARGPSNDLRFRAPVAPEVDRRVVQDGSEEKICPQGVPDWQSKAFVPIGEFSNGKEFTFPAWETAIANSTPPPIKFNEGAEEDCLFLDIYVPSKVMERARKDPEGCTGAPVLVWIHGGGYTFGSKLGAPNPKYFPEGLLNQARDFDPDGMIYVALNYGLGAFGFMSGPAIEAGGNLNAGLLDQRFALEWVQDKIHLFGGSRERVTVLGESGGAGSILVHMTGASAKAPFSQAIAQSPAMAPILDTPDSVYDDFLARLNVKTLEEVRNLPSKTLIDANAQQIKEGAAGSYVYGIVKDDNIATDHPNKLFKDGDFDKSVKLIASHNSLEGGFFFDPTLKTDEEIHDMLTRSFPTLSEPQKEYLLTELYPPQFDGSLGYVDQGSRQIAIWGNAIFDCNFVAANSASDGHSYGYEFAVSPGLHTQDLGYTFDDPSGAAFNPETQNALRSAITSFAINGVPVLTGDGSDAKFPRWGADETIVRIGDDGFETARNPVNATRCEWWWSLNEGSH